MRTVRTSCGAPAWGSDVAGVAPPTTSGTRRCADFPSVSAHAPSPLLLWGLGVRAENVGEKGAELLSPALPERSGRGKRALPAPAEPTGILVFDQAFNQPFTWPGNQAFNHPFAPLRRARPEDRL